ncbi:MAG: GTP-binding protein, partial [Clostridia bacterium]|nr:GTP-binding protein [Clostridia bacterium]
NVKLPEGLQSLNLYSTPISSLDRVKLPEGLQSLYLSYTQISSLDRVKLPEGLQSLKLSFTKISSLDNVKLPEGLQSLNLSFTKISSLDNVKLPEGLQLLDLSSNQISSLDRVKLPSGLKTICLEDLRLKSIPESLVKTGLPFILYKHPDKNDYKDGIYLKGTVLTEQDINLFRRDRATIEAHYRDLEANTERRLNECKVILLGDGEVGKTYIIDRISNNNERLPQDHKTDTTKGILLSTVQTADGETIESDASKFNDTDLKIRFWDFGGQQIMHSMHRCFLTSKTIYVIVVSGRKGNLTREVSYWLTTVAAFAKDSPVIVVTNKSDQYSNSKISKDKLEEKFPNIRGFIRFSALKSEKDDFAELSKKIYEIAANDMMFSYLKGWLRLKDELEHMDKDYIDDDEYRKKCDELGINGRLMQEDFLNWFHELSIMFRCPGKRGALDTDYMVLKPQWLINAMYSIICSFDDDKSDERNGQISHREILKVLKDSSKNADPNYKGQYNNDTVRYIIRVMHAFGISHELRTEWEFIPTLCRNETPEAAKAFNTDSTLKFKLCYSYLPENVLYRFMIKRKEHLDIENAWYHGALFDEKNGCRYMVSQDLNEGSNELLININTSDNMDASMVLGEIVTDLRGINEQIGLSADEFIIYSEAGKDYPIKYSYLIQQKKAGWTQTFIEDLGQRDVNDVLKCAVRDEVIERMGRIPEQDGKIPFDLYERRAKALETFVESQQKTINSQQGTISSQQGTISSQQGTINTQSETLFEMNKNMEDIRELLAEYKASNGRPKTGWLDKVERCVDIAAKAYNIASPFITAFLVNKQ